MQIKVLKFITAFHVGGTERQFVYLTQQLDRSRFEPRVACLSRRGEFLKDIETLGIPISEYNIASLYSLKSVRQQYRLARDIRRNGIDVIHAYGFYPNVFGIPSARLSGRCVTIASVRDTGAFSTQIQLKSLAQKVACGFADRIVVNSAAVRNWLTGLGVSDRRIHVIHNGVAVPAGPAGQQDFPIRRELGIEVKSPVAAVVCRLVPGKGLEHFLEAASVVRARIPSARFLVVGDSLIDPAYKTALQDFSRRLNLADAVIFTGERRDVQKLLLEVNLSVLPSLSEGFSNSLLEAMAAGLPVVATNVGGNPEIVEHGLTGFLVPARDPAALSGAMIRILAFPPLARQFGEAGYQRVARKFSMSAMIRQTEDLYSSLVEEHIWRMRRKAAA